MKITKKLHFLVLAIFLVLSGLSALIGLSFIGKDQLMALLAIAAGVCLLLEI